MAKVRTEENQRPMTDAEAWYAEKQAKKEAKKAKKNTKAEKAYARHLAWERFKSALSLRNIGYAILCVAIAALLIWFLFGTKLGKGILSAVSYIVVLLGIAFGAIWLWRYLTKRSEAKARAKAEAEEAKRARAKAKKAKKPAEKVPEKPSFLSEVRAREHEEEAVIREMVRACSEDEEIQNMCDQIFWEEDPELKEWTPTPEKDSDFAKRVRAIAKKVYADEEYAAWAKSIMKDAMASSSDAE